MDSVDSFIDDDLDSEDEEALRALREMTGYDPGHAKYGRVGSHSARVLGAACGYLFAHGLRYKSAEHA